MSSLGGDSEPVFGNDADENLKRGEEALAGKNFPDAQRYFEFVKTKYPFLDAAKMAELKLADVDFERERYVEARDRYENFVRLHPTHPKVDYAAFRRALTHYRDIPSDFFILPPSSEKDQVELRAALVAMVEFTRNFPTSALMPEAQKVLTDVKHRLAEHELYVADFYARRDRWPAVVNRLNTVAKSYSGVGFDERVYFGLYDAYRSLKDEGKARDALRQYIARFPDSDGAKKAIKVLGPDLGPPSAPEAAPDAGT